MGIRYSCNQRDVKRYTTEELRDEFLIENLYVANTVQCVYSHVDRAKTPAALWGTPEDLMGPAVFLASDASNFVNGHVLYVDGGILAYIGKQP